MNTKACTSDLDWCWRVIDGGYFKKAGWDHLDGVEHPFLVDTSIQCGHINPSGLVFPGQFVTVAPDEAPPDLGVAVEESAATAERVG